MLLIETDLYKVPNNNNVRKIALLTSGGDSPGMNAAIRAVTRSALACRMQVYGVMEGFRGLMQGTFKKMNAGTVGDIIQRGGTILRTARLDEFRTDKAVRDRCYANLRKRGIDALVVLGGDGSFQGAALLAEENPALRVVGLPCTIDNDLAYTDYTIGFDTAVNTCIDMINNLRDTMNSHDRIAVVEVMGRKCGDIAIHAGIAAGAEAIIIPESERTDEEWLAYIQEKLEIIHKRKKEYGIIVMAEGMHSGDKPHGTKFTAKYVSEKINKFHGPGGNAYTSRPTELGHIQRGGSPSASDRLLASTFGIYAVKVLKAGENRRCVGIRNNKVYDMDIGEAVQLKKSTRNDLIDIADILAR